MMDLNIIDNEKRTEVEDHIAVLLAGVTFNGITNNGARFRLRNSQGMNNIGEETHAEGHQDFILEIDIVLGTRNDSIKSISKTTNNHRTPKTTTRNLRQAHPRRAATVLLTID
jgi:hypothetical protein